MRLADRLKNKKSFGIQFLIINEFFYYYALELTAKMIPNSYKFVFSGSMMLRLMMLSSKSGFVAPENAGSIIYKTDMKCGFKESVRS